MSMLTQTHKHTQTKNDFTLVYQGDCCYRGHFSGNHVFFLFQRTALEKWVVRFMLRSCGKRLIEIMVYQVYTRNCEKWFVEIEGYQVYAQNVGFFCSLEKIEYDGLTIKTH